MQPRVIGPGIESGTPLQVLWRDSERVFARASGDDAGEDRPTVLVVVPAAEYPTVGCLDRLAHEFSLKDDLDAPWAVRPLELVRERGRTRLVLDDPGGVPLSALLGAPMETMRFLRLAEAVAAALRGLHGRGLVHKDISPANVLVDEAGGHAWLTGFGIASRLPRERQTLSPPESLAGTLAYMAPEQTGRMNRSIDSRSDLYALGVTFYEMLTGVLPFDASDPMEWVHCHVARQPVAPADRRAIAPMLSAITMRLLAKNAEERYQTAAGLEADLRRCLSQWRSDGRIDPFPLGADDESGRLLIPEKLYGREREVDALLAAFDRVATRGAVELVLVSGYSGVGKSSVVNELHKALAPPRGLFAAGKFDQYKRDVPYATLAQAFQTLVRQILAKGETELQDWGMALGEALGANGRLIVDLIPELELIVGPQPPVAELAPQDARRRFQAVLRRFIGVFARPEHPLALFLDDLQWLDAATLDLLEAFLTQGDIGHLLLIGAYRDNEVDAAHPLMHRLEAIRRTDAAVQDIVLAPLSYRDLEQLIGDTLRAEAEHAAPLARIVDEKTGGNPFFAIQFLHTLADEAMLGFDHAKARWSWDADRIHAKRYTDNVVDLMVAKLGRLPAYTVAALRQLSCIGFRADFALLATVCQTAPEALHDSLWAAVRAGMLLKSETAYVFQHDRIQEAAYSLIPEEERPAVHLRIGRLLLEHWSPDAQEEIIFEIAGHFDRSATLVTADEERERVARLNLMAGMRARNATAYASALTYFGEGCERLPTDCWTRQYALTFELELRRAEAEFLTGEIASAEKRLSSMVGRAMNLVDHGAVTCLQTDIYNALSKLDQTVAVSLRYLRAADVEWPADPAETDVQREYDQVWRRLGSRRIEDLIDLPVMVEPSACAIMDMLVKVMASTQSAKPNLFRLMVARMVNLSLVHGNSDASCCGYVWFGWAFGADFDDPSMPLRFAQLGRDLVDIRGLDAFKGRVYLQLVGRIAPLAQSVRSCRTLIAQAFEVSNRIGDVIYAGLCKYNSIGNSLFIGNRIDDLHVEVSSALDYMKQQGSETLSAITVAFLYTVRGLAGLPTDFMTREDGAPSETDFAKRLEAEPNLSLAACSYWIRRLQTCVFAADYPEALKAATKAGDLLVLYGLAANFIDSAEYHFFAALAYAGSIDRGGGAGLDARPSHLAALAGHYEQLQRWALQCPENFENRAALVGAEIARLEGRDLDAEGLYQLAVRSARNSGFIHAEALAVEAAAHFYAARGFDDIAEMYLQRALDGYQSWGADGVVRRLEASYPWLAAAVPPDRARGLTTPEQQLDVAAVVKASQALSSEIVLPRLVERLMTIALQNAGADRGLLILPHEGDYRVEVAARADGGSVALQQGVLGDSAAPESLIRYAIRTQETVILDDAIELHLFSEDPDLALRRPRSILCLPLVRQGSLRGLIYLENTLAPHVFTPERARLLELLASQAAISLENARLYADLELQVGLLQQLPVSAWTLRPDGTPDFVNQVWLDFSGQTLEFVRSHPEAWMTAVHPEDRETAAKILWEGVRSGEGFAFETRSLRARDGTYRRHLQQAVVLRDAEGGVLRFVGTTTDIDDQKRAEETLRGAQSDLAHVARVATLNAMTASIAHEVSQPLSGVLTNASTGLRMLAADPPNLDGAIKTAQRTIRDANRAAGVLKRLREMFSKKAPITELVDLNDLTRDVIAIAAGEVQRRGARLQTELAGGLPLVSADRVQLQQVILNLLLNAADAMEGIDDRPRSLLVRTGHESDGAVRLEVRDAGTGIDPATVERLFEPFHTTKANGMGVGLSICRSIVESHEGRLWATPNDGPGATFGFSIPVAPEPAARGVGRAT